MDEFDRLALAAAHEVMRDNGENSALREAARIVLGIAWERGWLTQTGAGDEYTHQATSPVASSEYAVR
jgi:hypothetical protein